MVSDAETSIRHLKDRIAEFAREREWDQFHSPKNLSMALAVEAAELMELFEWKTEEETACIRGDRKTLRRVREEVADVAVYLLNLCNRLNIDLAIAIIEKLALNARKYPVEVVKGKSTKYTDLSVVGRRPAATTGSRYGSTYESQQLELKFGGSEERDPEVAIRASVIGAGTAPTAETDTPQEITIALSTAR
jgi:NTP pyrophosphatase (non-canonical NTP hydrolase)